MFLKTISLSTASLLSLLCFGSAHAEDKRSLRLTWENDTYLNSLFNGRYTDRHYTQGLWFDYMHRDDLANEHSKGGFLYASTIMRSIWNFGMEIERTRGGFSFGQTFSTPENIGDANFYSGVGTSFDAHLLQEDDRPYAGYAFLEPKWERRGRSGLFSLRSVPTKDRFSIALGIVGPSAGAEAVQTKWHDFFENGLEPVGWRHQLSDEFIFNLHADRTWLFTTDTNTGGPQIDFMPTLGIDLGNLSTRLTARAELRFGIGDIHDFSLPSLESSDSDYGIFAFASVEGWAVGHNIFLDGNTFSNSHSVSKENWVGEVSLGVGLKLAQLEAQMAWVRRSVEFNLQDVPNSYLSAEVTWKF